MAVKSLRTTAPAVELVGDRLYVHEIELGGAIVEVAKKDPAGASPERLERLLQDAADIGGRVLLHGQYEAEVTAFAVTVEQLMSTVTTETGKLPPALQKELKEHLKLWGDIQARYFDSERTTSVQQQVSKLLEGATKKQVKEFLAMLREETGPDGHLSKTLDKRIQGMEKAQLDLVGSVTSLVAKVEDKMGMDVAREKSTQKGAPFEETLRNELEGIHCPLGDEVRPVAHERGVTPGSKAGDFVVTLSREETRGRDVRIAVEAKTGKLSGPAAQKTLELAMKNRDALAGVLVFDGVADAPLGGRRYRSYPGARFMVVLDVEDRDPLPLEVACRTARVLALASLKAEGAIDADWLLGECDQIAQRVDNAQAIKRGVGDAKRGLEKVDLAYEDLRREVLEILDNIRVRVAPGD